MSDRAAVRISIAGEVSDPALREDVRSGAVRLGLLGWVRLMEDDTLCVHAEGDRGGIDALISWLRSVGSVSERAARVEGHEQFAIRGVPAGVLRWRVRLQAVSKVAQACLPVFGGVPAQSKASGGVPPDTDRNVCATEF